MRSENLKQNAWVRVTFWEIGGIMGLRKMTKSSLGIPVFGASYDIMGLRKDEKSDEWVSRFGGSVV